MNSDQRNQFTTLPHQGEQFWSSESQVSCCPYNPTCNLIMYTKTTASELWYSWNQGLALTFGVTWRQCCYIHTCNNASNSCTMTKIRSFDCQEPLLVGSIPRLSPLMNFDLLAPHVHGMISRPRLTLRHTTDINESILYPLLKYSTNRRYKRCPQTLIMKCVPPLLR